MDVQRGLKTGVVMVVLGVVVVFVFCSAAFGQHCSASGGGEQYISGVVVGSLVNTGTGSDGYADYTSMSITMALGESQIATTINGLSITGSQCGIWVDWNADGDFDDAGEAIAMSGGPASFTGTVTPPGTATAGDKRMRVRIMGTGSLTACGDTTYGEVEDYTIGVVAPWTGIGDANDPYQIWTAEDMNAIGASSGYWGVHFKLMANIDLGGFTGTSFNIIGTHPDNPFTGVFDGNGRTISNFTYSSGGTNHIGLFRYVNDPNAEIKDVGLINPNVDGGLGTGSLVAEAGSGVITSCYVEGGSVSGGNATGGLVGANGGTIRDCYSSGSVSGEGFVGGLVGGGGGTITNCYSTGSVSSAGWDMYVGGLVGIGGTITNCWSSASVSSTGGYSIEIGGLVGHGGRISNCYATGSVTGSDVVGGLVGNGGIIRNCYATGSVSASNRVGGLAGIGGTISNCYSTGSVSGGGSSVGGLVGTSGGAVYGSFWDIETSGEPNSAGGTGLTTAQMKDANTYLYWGCEVGWTIDDGVDYPHLIWEGMAGEIIFSELSDFVGGAGTESDPYLIYTAEELNLIGLFWCECDKHFKLMADIDLSAYTGTSFNMIGNSGIAFSGVFDGNGHTISNFTYNVPGGSTIGLFGSVAEPNSEIKDLGLIDADVRAKKVTAVGSGNYVGALVGLLEASTISGCYVEGGSVSGEDGIGGLVARNKGTITNCYSTASVSADDSVGGLVGKNDQDGTISNCYSSATISGDESVGGLVAGNSGTITDCYSTASVSGDYPVGGLVGGNGGTISHCYVTGSVTGNRYAGGLAGDNGGKIMKCYSLGNVQGSTGVGGLVGRTSAGGTISNCYAWGSASAAQDRVGGLVGEHRGTMTNCYSIGSATGTTDVGGVVGWNAGAVSACFWDTQTSGRSNMCGSSQYGATGCDDDGGKTTAEMQIASTFTSAGWDFVDETDNGLQDIWRLCNTGVEYPQLNWQCLAGDFSCPDGVDGFDLGVLCEEWLLEELSRDVWPEGGDGIVNFLDWAIFADGWGVTADYDDLADFTEQWLKSGSNYLITDIAPGSGGDGITNGVDFAVLADNWLAGL